MWGVRSQHQPYIFLSSSRKSSFLQWDDECKARKWDRPPLTWNSMGSTFLGGHSFFPLALVLCIAPPNSSSHSSHLTCPSSSLSLLSFTDTSNYLSEMLGSLSEACKYFTMDFFQTLRLTYPVLPLL